MESVKFCRICVDNKSKLYDFEQFRLKTYYQEAIGYHISLDDGLPHYFCIECATLLYKFHQFRQKCRRSFNYLQELSNEKRIADTDFKNGRQKFKLTSNLSHMRLTERVGAFYYVEENYIPYDTNNYSEDIDRPKKSDAFLVKNEIAKLEIEFDDDNYEGEIQKADEHYEVLEAILNNKIPLRKKKITKPPKSKGTKKEVKIKKKKKFTVDDTKWKTVILTDEEAIREFEAKKEKDWFIRAPYKCMKCYRGFSAEEMFNRHNLFIHRESLGVHECEYCKMRFKWLSMKKAHLRKHNHRYHCLRCPMVVPYSTLIKMHEDKHDGVKYLCKICGLQYSHPSTYYTHLRIRHRSQHICNICGVSFVSKHGLIMHQKVKHVEGYQPERYKSDNEDTKEIYCNKCDIMFNNQVAYSEHLYHSAKHMDDVKSNEPHKCQNIPYHVNNLQKGKGAVKKKKYSMMNTSCGVCGHKFRKRSDCVNHYKVEHPDIPFSSSEKIVCEICGLSITSGNIGVHQNRHTRTREYSCSTCGRTFYNNQVLKNHMVVHTGEKPFACKMCDKKFTQGGSLYLHVKTFHLKQPYPKRIRKKKEKTEPSKDEADTNKEPNAWMDICQQ